MVEQLPCKQSVVGSSPSGSSKKWAHGETADARDLKSLGETRTGSNPVVLTTVSSFDAPPCVALTVAAVGVSHCFLKKY